LRKKEEEEWIFIHNYFEKKKKKKKKKIKSKRNKIKINKIKKPFTMVVIPLVLGLLEAESSGAAAPGVVAVASED